MRKDVGGKYQKYTSAYFGWVKFEAGPEAVRIIDEAFKKHLSIIRHLLIKTARENTMTVPKIPFYRRAPTSGGAPKVEENKEVKPEGKPAVSEAELDKAIDAAIAE